MEAGLDNANNPFNNSNGSLKNLDVDTDNINLQKSSEGLLLNLTDNFKTNGTDLSQDIFVTEKSNGTKKSASDIHFDDDFGPETDVDAVDDAFSPVEKEKDFSEDLSKDMSDECIPKPLSNDVKTLAEGLVNNNPLADAFNPFQTSQKEDRVEEFKELDFNQFQAVSREETPTPPADAVHDVGGLDVNPGESDSEDEWNYIKGDQAKPENLSSQPETVVETSEQDEMSQLNPNAAEFVPVSPTRSNPSPVCRALINDQVISQSPKRPERVDIKVPSEVEFESEVKSRPSDFDNKNGHDSDSDHNTSEADQIENILNGKNIDEIPEFHPGSTPSKLPAEEFHFGPNAAPFTPRSLDQSEAFSTKANFGDDTEQTLNTSFNDSELTVPNKEQTDPMSMSFYAEKGESNPFQDDEDLNKVHEIPENLDAFLEGSNSDKENSKLDGTLSDLPEHHPLGIPLDNDEAAIQTTDLDKISQDDEKELASPLEDHDDLLDANPNTSVPLNNLPDYIPFKISDPTLFDDFVFVNEKPPSDDSNIASLPELEPISAPASETEPEALSPQPALISSTFQEEEVPTSPAPLDTSTPILDEEVAGLNQSQHQSENAGLVNTEEVATDNLLGTNETEPLGHHEGRLEYQNPACEFRPESKSPEINFGEIQLPVCEMKQGIESTELEFNPKSEVENINFESKESSVIGDLAASPELACEYSHVPEYCDSTSQNVLMAESQSPIDLLQEQKQQEEEITSSIKDDVSSPIEQLSPIKSPESLIEEPVKPENLPLEIIETAEIHEDISKREAVLEQASNQDLLSDLSCSLPESQASIQQETKEIDMLEMLTAVEPSQTSLSNGFNNLAAEINEQICIKTDSIKPEFAEPAVITPSEESKTIDEIVASSPVLSQTEAPVEKQEEGIPAESEPLIPQAETLTAQIEEPKPVEVPIETPKEMPVLAPLPIIPATPQEVKEVKSEEKKSSIAGSGKKPIGKVEPRKSTSSQKVGAAKPSPRPATSPKTGVAPKVPSKIGTAKPTGIASKTTSAAAPKTLLLKPKTTSAKPIEKKPTVNADVKPLPRTLAKKPTTETTATKTISRPATTAAKTSPTKTTAPRPATATRTLAPKTSTIPPKPTAAPKPRVPLTSRTTTTTASSKLTTTASARTSATTTTRTMSATKTTPATPKPRTLTSAAPKPRVPLTKTVTKSAGVEKEKKESANKLTASRTTTVTKTTSGTASSRTTTTTVRKSAEIKPLSDRTASKTTITASKTTTLSKKPGDIKTTAKTKTTKIEKPKQNGVAPTNVTEEIKEITIVNNVVNETESENLLKDNSPLDNKLLIDTSNALIDMNPAD